MGLSQGGAVAIAYGATLGPAGTAVEQFGFVFKSAP
jgi:hypothetical protein